MLSLWECIRQILAFHTGEEMGKSSNFLDPLGGCKCKVNSHNTIDLEKLSANLNGENLMNDCLGNMKWFLAI